MIKYLKEACWFIGVLLKASLAAFAIIVVSSIIAIISMYAIFYIFKFFM